MLSRIVSLGQQILTQLFLSSCVLETIKNLLCFCGTIQSFDFTIDGSNNWISEELCKLFHPENIKQWFCLILIRTKLIKTIEQLIKCKYFKQSIPLKFFVGILCWFIKYNSINNCRKMFCQQSTNCKIIWWIIKPSPDLAVNN